MGLNPLVIARTPHRFPIVHLTVLHPVGYAANRPVPFVPVTQHNETPSGASRMHEPRWGRLLRSPDLLAGGEGAGCLLSKRPIPLSALWVSGFGPLGLAIDPPSYLLTITQTLIKLVDLH